jgi:hypothetical protein
LERKDSGISVGEDERREAREAVMGGMKVEDAIAAGLGPNAIQNLENGGACAGWGSVASASPLGLSNYDALDEEDDWYEQYHNEDGEDDDGDSALPASPKSTRGEDRREKAYYTDWNLRDADDEDEVDEVDDESCLGGSSMPAELVSEKRPPSPPEGRMVELLREKERQQEILSGFLHFA